MGITLNLPCNIGDTVYIIINSVDIPYVREDKVIGFELWNKNNTLTTFIRTYWGWFEYNTLAFTDRGIADQVLREEYYKMKKKIKVEMVCIATVWVNEDIQGNLEIEEVEDIEEILEFEEK